jgi:hypothetical protein
LGSEQITLWVLSHVKLLALIGGGVAAAGVVAAVIAAILEGRKPKKDIDVEQSKKIQNLEKGLKELGNRFENLESSFRKSHGKLADELKSLKNEKKDTDPLAGKVDGIDNRLRMVKDRVDILESKIGTQARGTESRKEKPQKKSWLDFLRFWKKNKR